MTNQAGGEGESGMEMTLMPLSGASPPFSKETPFHVSPRLLILDIRTLGWRGAWRSENWGQGK